MKANEVVRFRCGDCQIVFDLCVGTWLDPTTPADQLQALLRPYPAEGMEVVPVGSYVSNPRNEGPGCLAS